MILSGYMPEPKKLQKGALAIAVATRENISGKRQSKSGDMLYSGNDYKADEGW